MIYLASPYSHPDAAIREERFHAACRAAAQLMRTGNAVYAPICHSHPIARFGLPTEWSFWEATDREHLARCTEVVVLLIDGWQESEGIQREIRIAKGLRKPLRYLDPPGTVTLAHVAKEANG